MSKKIVFHISWFFSIYIFLQCITNPLIEKFYINSFFPSSCSGGSRWTIIFCFIFQINHNKFLKKSFKKKFISTCLLSIIKWFLILRKPRGPNHLHVYDVRSPLRNNNVRLERFLHGNIPLRHLLISKAMFRFWQRATINEVSLLGPQEEYITLFVQSLSQKKIVKLGGECVVFLRMWYSRF